jgi:hypothetical protein
MGRCRYEFTMSQYEDFLNNTVKTENGKKYGSWLRKKDPDHFRMCYLTWIRDIITY